MASILTGYEYDIFISYRQKDNKYDGWVTEFVENLKREIEATFKEDVSIYFDENPHDGLLEIHNVDKSLETKLRSLVFIPVISQTYVDPKSFAWQNEFVAFNRMASADQFGRDIKLASGNVCSRIVPVKIHDLDAADTELIESEMGSRLRSIDFIFSGAGVNRPLKPSDNPDKNLNKTFYRDQINKVANAVKDIIYGLHPDPQKRAVKSYQSSGAQVNYGDRNVLYDNKAGKKKRLSVKQVTFGLTGLLLIVALAFIIPKLAGKRGIKLDKDSGINKSIAVLPVSNLTGNQDLEYIAEALQDDITGRLGAISSLNVRPSTSVIQFKDSKESASEIARKLSVNNLVEASIKGTEDKLQIEVRLVEVFPAEKYVWTSSFTQDWSRMADIYKEIVGKIVDGTGVRLTSLESKNLSLTQKHDPELYKLYKQGRFHINRNTKDDFEKGLKCFNEAMKIDPADPLPYLGLAVGYSSTGHSSPATEDYPGRAKSYALQALELDSTLAEAHVVLAERFLYTEWDYSRTEYHIKRAIELNPNIASAYYTSAWSLLLKNKKDDAVNAMKRSVEIAPTDITAQGYLAWLHLFIGNYEETLKEAKKLLQLDENSALAYSLISSAYAEMGMNYEAVEMAKKSLSLSPGYESSLAVAYIRAGKKAEAMEVIAEMEKYDDQWGYAYSLAQVYALMGETGKALDNIETAFKLHGDYMPWIQVDNSLKSLRSEPRFKEIVRQLNLPE